MLIPQSSESQIVEAIRQAESKTTGEIVVAEVDRSGSYSAAGFVWALALMFAASAAMILAMKIWRLWLYEPDELGMFVLGQVLALGVGYALSWFGPLRRLVVSRAAMDQAVRARAAQAFSEHGLVRTHDRNGVLIFLSRFERQVQILADVGIDSRVPAGTWSGLSRKIVDGIRSNTAVPAISAAVSEVGALLSQHFPKTPEDTDEFPNEIRRT
jgi:putative membrane protein